MILRLLIYDIENDAYRNKLAKLLEAQGLVRLQKSVFAGVHTQHQWKKLWKQVEMMHQTRGQPMDKIYNVVVSQEMFKSMKCLGQGPAFAEVLSEELTLWI